MNFEPVLKDLKDTITKLIEENKKLREALTEATKILEVTNSSLAAEWRERFLK